MSPILLGTLFDWVSVAVVTSTFYHFYTAGLLLPTLRSMKLLLCVVLSTFRFLDTKIYPKWNIQFSAIEICCFIFLGRKSIGGAVLGSAQRCLLVVRRLESKGHMDLSYQVQSSTHFCSIYFLFVWSISCKVLLRKKWFSLFSLKLEPPLHPYEQLRLRQCMRNNSRLQQLGIPALSSMLASTNSISQRNRPSHRNSEDSESDYDISQDETGDDNVKVVFPFLIKNKMIFTC